MANSSNKTIYIIVGVVGLVIAIPVVILIIAMGAGFVFYLAGSR